MISTIIYIKNIPFVWTSGCSEKMLLHCQWQRFNVSFSKQKLNIRMGPLSSWRFKEKKGRDLTQSCDKNPYTLRTIKKATWQHKNATKNVDYITIADRLRTVNWSNSSHPTGVVKPVHECSTFPLTAKVVLSIVHGTDGYILKDNQE